jgi:hypothetical protein
MYRLLSGGAILRDSDGLVMPPDPSNADYQDFLTWVSQGNTPDPPPSTSPSTEGLMYQLLAHDYILRKNDSVMIPPDPANADYQVYLAWVAEGNTADPPPPPPPHVSIISATDWLNRFSPAEQLAVQAACLANPTIQLGLTVGLAQGWIDLAQPRAANWLAMLVAAGAIAAARVPTLLALPA